MKALKGTPIKFLAWFLFIGLLLLPRVAFSEEKSSVMFMIAEQNIGQQFYIFWWSIFGKEVDFRAQDYDLSVAETILKEEFINAGFEVIDIANASEKIKVSKAYKIADLTKDSAIEMGKNVGADVVVKGKVIAKAGPKAAGSNVGSYIADITVTAFKVGDGTVVGAGRGHGVARNISEVTGGTEAIDRASRNLAEKLIEQIDQKMVR